MSILGSLSDGVLLFVEAWQRKNRAAADFHYRSNSYKIFRGLSNIYPACLGCFIMKILQEAYAAA